MHRCWHLGVVMQAHEELPVDGCDGILLPAKGSHYASAYWHIGMIRIRHCADTYSLNHFTQASSWQICVLRAHPGSVGRVNRQIADTNENLTGTGHRQATFVPLKV